MSAPTCPNGCGPMAAIAPLTILRNPGMPDYTCNERGCWARAWTNPDGTVTKTDTTAATWDELKRRVRAAEAAGRDADGESARRLSAGSEQQEGASDARNAA